jgi:hypothetical protein
MNDIQKIDYQSFQHFCNQRSKHYRYKGERHIFKQTIYNYTIVLREEHNCEPCFITVTFAIDKENRHIEKEWCF